MSCLMRSLFGVLYWLIIWADVRRKHPQVVRGRLVVVVVGGKVASEQGDGGSGRDRFG